MNSNTTMHLPPHDLEAECAVEMSLAQLFGRAVARNTQICSGRITNPATHGDRMLSDSEIGMVERASDKIERLPIYIANLRTI